MRREGGRPIVLPGERGGGREGGEEGGRRGVEGTILQS